jgi:hypothetical protein
LINLRLIVFGALLVCLLRVSSSYGQNVEILPIQGTFKGGAIHGPSGTLYVSDYDQDKIIKIDLATKQIIGELKVGDGPTRLSLSDSGNHLACLNRLDQTISLIDLSLFQIKASPKMGAGPSDIASLPGGGFAVTNAFDDSLLLIDENAGQIAGEMMGFDGIPVAVASSGEYMAVGIREPNELVLFQKSSTDAFANISLPNPPRKILALVDGRFLVETIGGDLVTITSDNQTAEEYEGKTGKSYFDSDEGYLVIDGSEVSRLNNQSTVVATIRLDQPVSTAFSAGEVTVFVTLEGKLIVHGQGEVTTPRLPIARIDEAPLTDQEDAPLAQTKAKPVDEPPVSPKEPAVSPKEPAVSPREPAESPKEPAVSPKEPAESALETDTSPDGTGAPSRKKQKSTKKKRTVGKMSFKSRFFPPATAGDRGRPARASIMGLRPHAPELSAQSEGNIKTTLNDALSLAQPGGLFNVDLPETLVIDADDALIDGETGDSIGEGNVQFNLGDAVANTDYVLFNKEDNHLILRGNVDVSSETSSLTADYLEVEAGKKIEATEESPLVGPPLIPIGWNPPPPSSSFETGILIADNLVLDEPERHIEAEHLELDMELSVGELRGAKGRIGPIYFNADSLRILGPADAEGEEVWVTTCENEVPHYRIRMKTVAVRDGNVVFGSEAGFQLGKFSTPFFIPRIGGLDLSREHPLNLEFDMGRRSELGYFLNIAQWYALSPNVEGAIRLFPTTREGVGFGIDGKYDFMDEPSSPLFRSKGELQTMYTTEKRGYTQWYHRQELTPRTVLLGQWEQWYDRAFVKDFYNDIYEDRTGPRTFMNLTHTNNAQIFGLTASKATHDFTMETEKLPEATYHLLERRLFDNFYLSYDAAAGYYEHVPDDTDSTRLYQAARLSYDWNVKQGFNILPFAEVDTTWYSRVLSDQDPDSRITGTAGVTMQSRFQRSFAGRWGFSGLKHIVVPSVTYSFRPDGSLESDEVPRFDDFDDRPGRSRLETKIDNILLGRDAESKEVWAVARVAVYYGKDFWNESDDSTDYEIDMAIRPRPQWGIRTIAERHDVNVEPGDTGDELSRVLAFAFYENDAMKNPWNGRFGFAYTDVGSTTINRELLYGAGYRINDKWAVSADHRYDLERNEISRQSYQIRRRLHRWEMGLRIRERDSGLDLGIEFSLIDFGGAKIRF